MKRSLRAGIVSLGVAAACSVEAPESAPAAPQKEALQLGAPHAEGRAEAQERVFGAPLRGAGPVLSVAQVLENPEPHLGEVIQCSGVVARVCENAGCWLELRSAPDHPEGLRVPMAGHAFFIPQDAVGHRATVEGQLSARPLSEAQRAHLEREGLKAVGPLSLAATSVVVR